MNIVNDHILDHALHCARCGDTFASLSAARFVKCAPPTEAVDATLVARLSPVLSEIGMRIAREAIVKTPERACEIIDRVSSEILRTTIGGRSDPRQLTQDIHEWEAIIGTVFYFYAVKLAEAYPDVRRAVAEHLTTCTDHTNHKLELELDDDDNVVM